MAGNRCGIMFVRVLLTASLSLLHSPLVRCQNAPAAGSSGAPAPSSPGAAPGEAIPDIRMLAESVRALQAQVQSLNSQVSELRAAEEKEHAEARALRNELNRATAKLIVTPGETHDAYVQVTPPQSTSSANATAERSSPVAAAGGATSGEPGA